MAIQVTCAHCHAKLTTDDSKAGRRAKCPKCGGVIEIPVPRPADDDDEILDPEIGPPLGFSDEEYELEAPPPEPAKPADRKPCPMCGEMIARDAVKCRYCGEIFDETLKKSAKKGKKGGSHSEDEDLSAGEWVLAILCSNIACIFAIVWMIQGKPKGTKMLLVALGMQALWFVIGFVAEAMQNM